MTEWKKVTGSQPARPEEFDTTSSATTVYQRRKVKRITVKSDGTTTELWQYDEREMTFAEYDKLRMENTLSDLDAMTVDHELRIMDLELGISEEEV